MNAIDPFDVLRDHLRSQVVADPVTDIGDLVDQIFEGRRTGLRHHRRAGRLRRCIAFGAGATILVGSGFAAASILRSDAPTRVDVGLLCRATPDVDSSASLIELDDDPIGACRKLWESGEMAAMSDVGGGHAGSDEPSSRAVVPDLVACVGAGGVVEVFPLAHGVAAEHQCGQLDLGTLGTAPLTRDPIARLGDRVSLEVNATCVPIDDAPAVLGGILRDLDLVGWQILVEEGVDPCARVALDPDARTLHVLHARAPTSTQPFTTSGALSEVPGTT